jgi:membrane-associated phospholipid phosphatase
LKVFSRRLLLAAPALLLAQPAAASSQDDWATVSDIGRGALVAWSLGVPLVDGDTDGALQAAGSIGAAGLLTIGLKETFPEMRPDGSDNKSFPSGHTSVSFAAASSILERRGAAEGVPALVLASLVGVARIEADKHHWYDVLVGAGIGTASGLLLTHRLDEGEVVTVGGDSQGVQVSYSARF